MRFAESDTTERLNWIELNSNYAFTQASVFCSQVHSNLCVLLCLRVWCFRHTWQFHGPDLLLDIFLRSLAPSNEKWTLATQIWKLDALTIFQSSQRKVVENLFKRKPLLILIPESKLICEALSENIWYPHFYKSNSIHLKWLFMALIHF